MSSQSSASPSDEDRRQHLIFIEEIISRMAKASSAAKGWSLTLATATYGVAISQNSPGIALLGVASVALFAYLDSHYLHLERQYRLLFAKVAERDPSISLYNLSLKTSCMDTTDSRWRKWRFNISGWFPPGSTWFSWSIFPFYFAMIVAGLAVYLASGSPS